jgi:hypothetical protein
MIRNSSDVDFELIRTCDLRPWRRKIASSTKSTMDIRSQSLAHDFLMLVGQPFGSNVLPQAHTILWVPTEENTKYTKFVQAETQIPQNCIFWDSCSSLFALVCDDDNGEHHIHRVRAGWNTANSRELYTLSCLFQLIRACVWRRQRRRRTPNTPSSCRLRHRFQRIVYSQMLVPACSRLCVTTTTTTTENTKYTKLLVQAETQMRENVCILIFCRSAYTLLLYWVTTTTTTTTTKTENTKDTKFVQAETQIPESFIL